MYSRMEKNHGQKVQRFSIRKYSFGAASVAVAAYMMFGGAATVQAHEQGTSTTVTSEKVNSDAGNQADSSKPVDSTGTATSTAEQPATPAPATPAPATPAPAPAPTTKADTSKLEAAVARMEAALGKAVLTEKTASAIEAAKAELANAKALEANEKATQADVDKAAKELNNKAFVLESMPKAKAEKKEEKENKNQDSRNGKAIPGQGESGFRTVDTSAANSAEEAAKYKAERDNALTELQANIAKIQAKLDEQKAKDSNKKDQAVIDTYTKVIEKANGVVTKANAAEATSAKEMSKQAEAVKSERDLLKLYLDGKADLGAPVSENHAGYGNNPSNGVFESLKEGFGDKVTFSDADKKSFTVAKQYESGRDLTNKIKNLPDAKDPIGSATYNWQEKAITKADAEAGMLNGWKIENGEKVNAVKPLDVTNVTDKDGNTSDREVWKSKVYTNDGELIKYQTSGEVSYVNGSGLVPLAMPTITGRASEDSSKRVLGMQNNTFGEVKNRDYYLELGSQGTTLSKEYDVNALSRLTVSLIHSGAYGGSTATDAGERVKLKIVDAFTGAEIKPVDGKDGALTTEQGPYSGTGWTHLDRLYDIPEGTTKVKVLIEAGEQGTNSLINDNNIKLKDGYIIGGIGIATAPAAEVVTNVRSQNKEDEYGYTKDTIYEKGQKGVFDIDIKNTGGMNIDYYTAQKVEVTVKVPKGVTLEDKIYDANGGGAYLGNTYANDIVWTPNDPADKTQGGTITYKVPAGNRMPAAEGGSRKTEIPFTTADNFIGPADFKVTVKSGFGDTDALGNRLYSYTALGGDPAYSNQFNRNGLADSDNPDYVYGKVIFINSLKGSTVVTVPINTTDDQLKEVAIAKAKEEVASANFTQLLEKMKATAALGDTAGSLSNVTISSKDKVEITKIAEDGRGIVKVPVTYTADGKTYETTVDVEVNVVKSTTKPLVVFEGDEISPTTVKENVTPAEINKKAGQANEPQATDIFDTNGKVGQTGLKVPTTVTYNVDGTTITENVEVPVTVLPKPKADEILVAKNSDKEDAKAKILEKAKAALGETYTNKLPDGVTFDKDNMTVGEIPALTEDGEVPVTVKYTVNGEEKTTVIKVPVTVVEGSPQIVPVDPKTAPKAEDSIDPADYPEGAKFKYEKEPDTSSTGDKEVKVIVTDKDGNELVKVPATVRVVDSKPQFVVADSKKPQPDVKSSITPDEYPTGTKFEYKEPVDTTTAGEKEVTVVAKLDGKTIVEVPAKVMVVDPKTQYVFEDPAKPQPSADESIDPDQYPEGTKFTYKDGEVDTTTPGDKKVTVVAKDGEDKLVEVPAVVKVLPLVKPEGLTVLKGSENLEAAVKAKAEEVVAALPKDKLPEGVTVKVKEVKAGTTPTTAEVTETGKPKPATVVVEYTDDKGNVIGTKEVEVPVTVIGSTPKSVVVFEGTTPEKDKVKESVTPGQGGTVGEPTTLPETAGKAGATDVTVEVPVTYDNGKVTEKVKVPVTVLPVAKADVTVTKGTTPEKLKELAKAKADEAIKAKDFTDKLPKDAKVTVGDVTKAIEDKVTAKKGTGVTTVEVPVTYTVDGKDYTTTIPVTVNVKGSDVKPVYVVEGDQPKADDVNKAITPDTDGTKTPVTDEDINKAIPTTEGKVGANDVKVTAKVTYKDGGEEVVTVPVTVLPKVSPKGVVVPKDTDKGTLEKAVADKVKESAENTKGLPEGVTVTVKETPLTTPGTETAGEKDSVTVTVEYKDKDGNIIATKEVKVPVIVTPKVTPVVVEVGTPVTAEDVKKHVDLPKDWEITNVGEIPATTTPGEKPTVPVEVKLPNGKTITVQVPVIVTPKVTPVVVEVGTPVTAEDVKKHVDLPEGWEITKVGEIPATTTPGEKPTVPVEVKLPNGKTVTVKVPVIVTPKVTPIEVEVGTPITKDDVKKHIELPKEEGWEIIEENWVIPTTETAGKKPGVKVKVKLPTGEIVELEVPVTVTPKRGSESQPNNGGGNGGNNYRPTPTPQNVPSRPTAPEQPAAPTAPAEPGQPATPNQTQPVAPAQADATVATDTTAKPATPKYVEGQKELPNTGTEDHASLAALGLLGVLSGFGLVARKKKED
ncbi:Rib/alpha-like domain-containing protein [Streptococcus sp. CL5.50]|uniref:Rib/alpha-like domain-containing protein n=1 Tax=Streptococcus sp. CL5.50 TaxID=3392242 RepID=UPI003C7B806A